MHGHSRQTNRDNSIGSPKQYSDMNENDSLAILNEECIFKKGEEDFLRLITKDNKYKSKLGDIAAV